MTPTELADALDREADRGITELPNRIVDLLTQASHALRRLGADAATLTHRAEVAERSCEDAKRREQETSAKMQAMAQSESNKALRFRVKVAEQSAALWRERCNKAEARVAAYQRELHRIACGEQVEGDGLCEYGIALAAATHELRRLYAAVCRGQTRSDDARAIAQAVIDEYVQTAEQCDRNDTLRADRDAARFLAVNALPHLLAVVEAAGQWCKAIDANDDDAQETRSAVYDAEEATRNALRALEAGR